MNLARLKSYRRFSACLLCGCALIHNSIEMLAAEYGEPVLPAPSDDWSRTIPAFLRILSMGE